MLCVAKVSAFHKVRSLVDRSCREGEGEGSNYAAHLREMRMDAEGNRWCRGLRASCRSGDDMRRKKAAGAHKTCSRFRLQECQGSLTPSRCCRRRCRGESRAHAPLPTERRSVAAVTRRIDPLAAPRGIAVPQTDGQTDTRGLQPNVRAKRKRSVGRPPRRGHERSRVLLPATPRLVQVNRACSILALRIFLK